MRRLVFFGDSICVGQGVSIHRGWVPRLAARIEEVRHDIVVVNASVNGNTTRQALERMPYEVQSGGLALMILQFGMNDCNYWETDGGVARVSRRAFEANLHEIIERAALFGASAVILNTNHPSLRVDVLPFTTCSYQDSNREYNETVRRVASDYTGFARLNDIEALFEERVAHRPSSLDEYVLTDGIHLSSKGHDVYLEATWPLVKELVEMEAGGSA